MVCTVGCTITKFHLEALLTPIYTCTTHRIAINYYILFFSTPFLTDALSTFTWSSGIPGVVDAYLEKGMYGTFSECKAACETATEFHCLSICHRNDYDICRLNSVVRGIVDPAYWKTGVGTYHYYQRSCP